MEGSKKKTLKLNKQLIEELSFAIDKACSIISEQEHFRRQFHDTLKTEKEECKAALRRAYDSTVIFAQYEAGTGVCISSSGLILTCAHCCCPPDMSTTNQSRRSKPPPSPPKKFILFPDGSIYLAQVVKADLIMDVALLQIIGVYDSLTCSVYQVDSKVFTGYGESADPDRDARSRSSSRHPPPSSKSSSANVGDGTNENGQSQRDHSSNQPTLSLPYCVLARSLDMNERLFCVGQPGRDDLESEEERKTDYHLIHISKGRFQQCLPGDICDNSEIGKLQHSCWTYWGHSGAPLLTTRGEVAGLHSSWDDETQTRHGVHVAALKQFFFDVIEIN